MHDFTPFYSPYAPALWGILVPFLIIIAIWTIVLKGFSLWYAARAGQKWWFIAMLIINTLGILEIIYLIWYRPKESHHAHTPEHKSSPA